MYVSLIKGSTISYFAIIFGLCGLAVLALTTITVVFVILRRRHNLEETENLSAMRAADGTPLVIAVPVYTAARENAQRRRRRMRALSSVGRTTRPGEDPADSVGHEMAAQSSAVSHHSDGEDRGPLWQDWEAADGTLVLAASSNTTGCLCEMRHEGGAEEGPQRRVPSIILYGRAQYNAEHASPRVLRDVKKPTAEDATPPDIAFYAKDFLVPCTNEPFLMPLEPMAGDIKPPIHF